MIVKTIVNYISNKLDYLSKLSKTEPAKKIIEVISKFATNIFAFKGSKTTKKREIKASIAHGKEKVEKPDEIKKKSEAYKQKVIRDLYEVSKDKKGVKYKDKMTLKEFEKSNFFVENQSIVTMKPERDAPDRPARKSIGKTKKSKPHPSDRATSKRTPRGKKTPPK